ncbi:MAG: hypothetical protein LC737_07515, partial [Chloroflexi bacterium]|nr:hypothetical protein [Chloroflexota bacterium]
MKRRALVLAGTMIAMSASAAFAHLPIFVQPLSNNTRAAAVRIANPDVSWAVYAQLTHSGEVNFYTFEGKQGQRIAISMLVPHIATLREFGVSVALVGRGFGNVDALPFALSSGEGALVAADGAHNDADIVDESFTGTTYWNRQTLNAILSQDGTYTVAVFNTRGEVGKYVLAIGEREQFGWRDLLDFPRT